MGQWVTSQGRKIYIPDEGEKVPAKYKNNVDKNFTHQTLHNYDTKRHEDHLKEAEENLAMLKSELKKHPNDIHTAYIKSRIKEREKQYKELKNATDPHTGQKYKDQVKKESSDKEKQIAKSKAEADKLNKTTTNKTDYKSMDVKQLESVKLEKLSDKKFREFSAAIAARKNDPAMTNLRWKQTEESNRRFFAKTKK